jgi:hypothetical protein
MSEAEAQLLDELVGEAEPELLLRSRTRIDAGRWWLKSPVWICITKSELILFAAARRRYFDRVPLENCRSSHYAAITGQLVIDPVETLRIKHLTLTPKEALEVLKHLNKN